MVADKQVLLIEFNELNFEALQAYAARGELPHFADFLGRVGYAETSSEARYEELEPWIQWVTAHTGLPLAQHGVFRLGDIVDADIPQIWEQLAEQGLRVGAISPMNAKCRRRDMAFFVPDPWTRTDIVASPLVRRMFDGIVQAVGDNATSRVSPRSLLNLAVGAAVTARPRNYRRYVALVAAARRRPWNKAIFLDLLLADLFTSEVRRHRPHFASLFLNAAAHIQHHYMFSSAVYAGPMRNPSWYVAAGVDPLLDVYRAYDHILGDLLASLPRARLMLATGLHQDPHPTLTYYWRLRDHAAFLTGLAVPFTAVEPLMSRDFVVRCADSASAAVAATMLSAITDDGGVALFEVDNRGNDLFVMLTYPHEIRRDTRYRFGDRLFDGLYDTVTFVAIKNGQHNGTGYFADSGQLHSPERDRFPLSEIPARIIRALTPA
ncbi:hypothetical protein K7957_11010 [Sphingomonas yunnanensis]|uniref:hypothetical protein n=1 Tax=Sphingomonas yunnanensis TaxID=310400 RepID=UPI001CA64F24|nr:hypothetical protein [Sphingomonas yunnanensis]MBY9063459.1 hypothetical protein [Sphingomonas yunnanensis]